MLYPISTLSILLLFLIHLTSAHSINHSSDSAPFLSAEEDTVPFSTRAFWMRKANSALAELSSPCPFAAFGTVIVNHTSPSSEYPLGKLVCYAVNANQQEGNPTLHGEIAGINNCTKILTDPEGEYKLTPAEALKAFKTLSLYTNAEPCPMCTSAILWSGFRECIFGTSIKHLINKGWSQITLPSSEIISHHSSLLSSRPRLIGGVLSNETDVYFNWQYDSTAKCPEGCARQGSGGGCLPVGGEGNQGAKREL